MDFPRGQSARARGQRDGPGCASCWRRGSRASPDVHYGDDRHFVGGDRGASEWTLTGTMAGKRIEVRGCDLFEFRGGKISRKDSYWKIVE